VKYSNNKYASVIFYIGHLPHYGGGVANTFVEHCSITAGEIEESGPNIVLCSYILYSNTRLPSGGGGGFGDDSCSGGGMRSTGASPKLVQAQLCILAYIAANPCRNSGVRHQEFTQQDVQRTNL